MRLLIWGIVFVSLFAAGFPRHCKKNHDNLDDSSSDDPCADAKATVQHLKDDLKSAEKDGDSNGKKQLEAQLAALKEKSIALQRELQNQQAQLQALQAVQESAKAEIAIAKNFTAQVQSLQGANVQLQTQAAALDQQVQTLTVSIKRDEGELLSLRSQLQAGQGAGKDKDAELLRLRTQLQGLEQLKKSLDQTTADAKQLQGQVTNLITSVNQCTSGFNSATSTFQQCQQNLANVRKQINAVPSGCTSQRRPRGRCAGQHVRFRDVNQYHEVSFDVDVRSGQNADSCRQLCFNDERCESADFLNNVCYLNGGRARLNFNSPLVLFMFDCC